MNLIPTDQLLAAELQNISTRISKSNQGFSSGYTGLDHDLMGGFQIGNLYCIGSVSSMGKTMVALNILVNQLTNLATNEVLVFVSTHTSYHVLIQKILAIATGIELRKIQAGDLTIEELSILESHPFLTLLKKNQLVLIENNTPTLDAISETLNTLINENKQPKMLFIDCLQDMQVTDKNTNLEQAIYSLLKSIKVVAAKVQVPVLITSKVSKRVFYRKESQIPQLHDLLHSRLIADVCDWVYMVLRPSYYQNPCEEDFELLDQELRLYGRKNKHLPLNVLMFRTDIRKYHMVNESVYSII